LHASQTTLIQTSCTALHTFAQFFSTSHPHPRYFKILKEIERELKDDCKSKDSAYEPLPKIERV
jgi:hypothetical protein